MAELTIRSGHPDFLDLPWDVSLRQWDRPNRVDLPMGISRHEVRFFEYPQGLYAIKELSERAALQDYTVLRALETFGAPAVRPVGIVDHRHPDPHAEESAALITEYEHFSFSYRELLAGPGFGPRRNQMLNAFAELLVELHLAGVFWGDCSLNNVLYRFDAEGIETVMVDAETAELYDEGTLSDGRRLEDLEIMIENVAGGMADIAAEAGHDLDAADLGLGEDIAARYRALWEEVNTEELINENERYKLADKIARLNALGFSVDEVELLPHDGGDRVKVKLKVGGRTFHQGRLKELTGVEALENQARQILGDLYYYQATHGGETLTGKNVSAMQWRVGVFEPTIALLQASNDIADPIQAYCDLLHHRYLMAEGLGRDVDTVVAYQDWLERGRPGQLPV